MGMEDLMLFNDSEMKLSSKRVGGIKNKTAEGS